MIAFRPGRVATISAKRRSGSRLTEDMRTPTEGPSCPFDRVVLYNIQWLKSSLERGSRCAPIRGPSRATCPPACSGRSSSGSTWGSPAATAPRRRNDSPGLGALGRLRREAMHFAPMLTPPAHPSPFFYPHLMAGLCRTCGRVKTSTRTSQEGNRLLRDVLGLAETGLGGEGGIRTHDTLARIPVFETGTFNRSVTSPGGRILPARGINAPVRWP